MRKDRSQSESSRSLAFDGYYRYEQILSYLNTVQEQNSNVEVIEYGKTAQNRPLVYAKITNDDTNAKPVIIIEAGIIPREWITIPAAINAINKLLEVENAKLLNAFDWIVIPVLNPDGYEYTHTDLRYWTKTLTTSSHLQSVCPGANINRNFDIDWLVSGSSSSPCSPIYSGIEPFSEIENQMVKNLLEEYGDRVRMFLSLQNNGPFITYPWQFDKAATGAFRLHHFLGRDMAKSIGSEYVTGVGSVTTDERISGTSSDFAQRSGVLYSFNINLKQDENDDVLVPEIADLVGSLDPDVDLDLELHLDLDLDLHFDRKPRRVRYFWAEPVRV
ncbi:unnamed protein product [Plutella xylostella]|uniref:(diamondback moth) hypothetical protein n=1 Tax=Plutella xylostella TaxID=51655 RepID=A0A8S4G1Y0_PLUXY|nr:unnamed protein product [Plutella xylostella]